MTAEVDIGTAGVKFGSGMGRGEEGGEGVLDTLYLVYGERGGMLVDGLMG